MAQRDAERQAQLAAQRAARRLAGKIGDIATQAKSQRSTGMRLPELDADPDVGSPTNLWVLADGRICWRTLDGVTHRAFPWEQLKTKFAPAGTTGGSTDSDGGSTSTKPKPADPRPSKYRKTYAATWGRTYCPQHGMEQAPSLRYGTFPGSSHGLRRIMLGFDDSTIRSDLSGATIRKVEISVRNDDAWDYSGVDLHWGAHNSTSPPSGFSPVRRNVWSGRWPHSGYGSTWRTVPDWYGAALRDGNARGLTLDQPSSAAGYYGAIDWSSARIRITYTK